MYNWAMTGAGACCATGVVMFGMGLRPDQPPKPFLGTPFIGTHILLVLITLASICIVTAIALEHREFLKNRAKVEP